MVGLVGWFGEKKENIESKEVNESLASHRPTIDVNLNRAVDLKLLSFVVAQFWVFHLTPLAVLVQQGTFSI